MEEILKNISVNDLEKIKLLLSIIPVNETKEIVTLRVFIDEYCNLIKQNRSKAYYTSVECAFKHLTDYFESRDSIKAIELKDVEKFMTYLQQKVKRGYRVYYRTLKAAFNKAVEWSYVKENYFHKVKLPKKQQANPVFINSNQLLAISKQIKIEVIKDFVVFAFYTGMRLNEIINLTWQNVNLLERIITVGDENFITKSRNQRYIPICEEVFEILKRIENPKFRHFGSAQCKIMNEKQKENQKIRSIKLVGDASTSSSASSELRLSMTNGFVFCKKDGSKYCGNYVSRQFKNVCKTAGMDQSIHFHSLRHSFASNLVQKGVPLYTIKELLGHSSISTTEIYSHLNMDSLREAIKKLDSPHPDLLPKGEGENHLKIFRINSGEK